MPSLVLLAARADDRRSISSMLEEMGHLAYGAGALGEAVEFARERRVKGALVVDGDGVDAETMTRELLRAFPLMPVLVAQRARDASRAVALMRAGAAEVVPPPWTPEELKACVSKGLRYQGTALSPVKTVSPRRAGMWYALAVGAALAAFLGAASHRRAERAALAAAARVDRWDLPVRHPAGLAHDGRALWVVEWFTQSFYALGEGAKVREVRHLTAETPVAAAWTPEALWTVSADGTVARRMRDDKMTALARYPRAAPSSAGLAFDGLYLWSLDARRKVLRRHLLDAQLSVAGTWRWPGVKPAGLVYDGRALWTLDAADRRLLRHSLERPDEVVDSLPLPEYGQGTYLPTGLAYDGDRFWTVGESKDGKAPARLVRHAPERR
jgi:DNA-binding response OmpR family regulator